MVLLAVALAYPDAIAITLSNAVNSKDAAAAFGEFDKAQSLGLGLPGYDLWRSREMAILGRGLGTTSDGNLAWKKAAASASSAEICGEDRFNATFQSAVIAITFGDLSRAESKARETIALAPNWYRPHLLLSQILGGEGRNTESVAELRTALNLGAPVNERQ